MLTTSASAQKKREAIPNTLSAEGAIAWVPTKQARIAYSGLVPRSPNTTPSAPTIKMPSFFPVFTIKCQVLPSLISRSLIKNLSSNERYYNRQRA